MPMARPRRVWAKIVGYTVLGEMLALPLWYAVSSLPDAGPCGCVAEPGFPIDWGVDPATPERIDGERLLDPVPPGARISDSVLTPNAT